VPVGSHLCKAESVLWDMTSDSVRRRNRPSPVYPASQASQESRALLAPIQLLWYNALGARAHQDILDAKREGRAAVIERCARDRLAPHQRLVTHLMRQVCCAHPR
jgi:hypothetical protein